MRYFIALVFPGLRFSPWVSRFRASCVCFCKLPLIGWIPATIWAFASTSSFHADKRVDKLVQTVKAR